MAYELILSKIQYGLVRDRKSAGIHKVSLAASFVTDS